MEGDGGFALEAGLVSEVAEVDPALGGGVEELVGGVGRVASMGNYLVHFLLFHVHHVVHRLGVLQIPNVHSEVISRYKVLPILTAGE